MNSHIAHSLAPSRQINHPPPLPESPQDATLAPCPSTLLLATGYSLLLLSLTEAPQSRSVNQDEQPSPTPGRTQLRPRRRASPGRVRPEVCSGRFFIIGTTGHHEARAIARLHHLRKAATTMILLYAQVGEISEDQLDFLIDNLEEEWPEDRDYYINKAMLDMLSQRGADANLIRPLSHALSRPEEVDMLRVDTRS